MLYVLSNIDNEVQELSKLPKPDMVVFVVFSNKPKNKTTIATYGKYCSVNNIQYHVCYFVGEKYNATMTCLNGIGSMYYKGSIMVL